MTVIACAIDARGCAMAADRAVAFGYSSSTSAVKLADIDGRALVGVSGSPLPLRWYRSPAGRDALLAAITAGDVELALGDVADALRIWLGERRHGYTRDTDGVCALPGESLIATPGGIYVIDTSGAVHAVGRYWASGSGREHAVGALYALDGRGGDAASNVLVAVRAAMAHDPHCSGEPFVLTVDRALG